MYAEDSFYTLSELARLGLLAVSAFLTLVVVVIAIAAMRQRRGSVRVAIAVMLFSIFVWILTNVIITPGHAPTLFGTIYTFQNCASPFGAFTAHQNRQNAKSEEIIERAQLPRDWNTFSKP